MQSLSQIWGCDEDANFDIVLCYVIITISTNKIETSPDDDPVKAVFFKLGVSPKMSSS